MGRRGPQPRPPEERFWEKVEKSDGCWIWRGARKGRKGYDLGYGFFNVGQNKIVNAHRFAYESLVGEIPPGHQLDHQCDNPPCVNPAHLVPVTDAEHKARHRMTHCREGHVIVTLPGGKRRCRECHAQRENARYHARRAALV